MNKNLALILSGQFVSQIGDKFYMLALAIWVLDTTNSPAMMGGVLFCSFFPTFLMGFIAGAFVDRYDRKIIIVAADFIRGLVIAVVACLYFFKLLNIQTFFGLGTVLTALIISFYNINGREVSLLFGGVLAFGSVCLAIAYLSLSKINSVMIYLGPFLLLGSFIILAATCFRTLLQKNVENEIAGRVFGAAGTIGDISIPIAMLTYGFLLRLVSCSWLMATTGVVLILLSGLFYCSYRRIDVPDKGHLVIDPEFHE